MPVCKVILVRWIGGGLQLPIERSYWNISCLCWLTLWLWEQCRINRSRYWQLIVSLSLDSHDIAVVLQWYIFSSAVDMPAIWSWQHFAFSRAELLWQSDCQHTQHQIREGQVCQWTSPEQLRCVAVSEQVPADHDHLVPGHTGHNTLCLQAQLSCSPRSDQCHAALLSPLIMINIDQTYFHTSDTVLTTRDFLSVTVQ